jgi:transcriptional regulator with XRE-family HTH domain
MDDKALGRRFRAIRHQMGARQADIGAAAGLSQDVISLVEVGRIEDVSVRALRRHAKALGANLRIELWFRGAELDRLLDEGHAVLVGAVAARLGTLGWEVRPEVSFAVYGERGSIDVVGWHAASGTLLVVEVKTELGSIEETLRRHDAKTRLAARVVEERFGWRARRVARLLVLPEHRTARRQVERHEAVMNAAYPMRGHAFGAWLREPAGAVAALVFMSGTNGGRAPSRVARPRRIRRGSSVHDPA